MFQKQSMCTSPLPTVGRWFLSAIPNRRETSSCCWENLSSFSPSNRRDTLNQFPCLSDQPPHAADLVRQRVDVLAAILQTTKFELTINLRTAMALDRLG